MRIARGLRVDDLPDGGVRVRADDWPWAPWVAAPCLLAGLPLVAWSAATAHWIELGGGAVFCAFAALCARLAVTGRRDLEVRAPAGAAAVRATDARRGSALDLGLPASAEIRGFPVPEGAPDLPDRGGDLVLRGSDGEIRLARRTGPAWRAELESARSKVVSRIPSLG